MDKTAKACSIRSDGGAEHRNEKTLFFFANTLQGKRWAGEV